MLPPRELHMSASIIPPLPDPPSSPLTSPLPPLQFFRLTSVSFVSLPPYDGGERGTLLDSLPPVGGFTSPSLPPPGPSDSRRTTCLHPSLDFSPLPRLFLSAYDPLVRLSKAFSPRSPRGTPLGYFQAICFVNARNLDQSPSPVHFFFARFSPPFA